MKNPADLLREKAELFEEKDKEYGAGYKQYGKVMKEIFPYGVMIEMEDEDTWNKMGIFNMIVHKVLRIANTGFGSMDSVRDLQVYGAMLEELMLDEHPRLNKLAEKLKGEKHD